MLGDVPPFQHNVSKKTHDACFSVSWIIKKSILQRYNPACIASLIVYTRTDIKDSIGRSQLKIQTRFIEPLIGNVHISTDFQLFNIIFRFFCKK